jgi:hypothetical protein
MAKNHVTTARLPTLYARGLCYRQQVLDTPIPRVGAHLLEFLTQVR